MKFLLFCLLDLAFVLVWHRRLNRTLAGHDHSAYQLQVHEAQLWINKAGHNRNQHQPLPTTTVRTPYHDPQLATTHQVCNHTHTFISSHLCPSVGKNLNLTTIDNNKCSIRIKKKNKNQTISFIRSFILRCIKWKTDLFHNFINSGNSSYYHTSISIQCI